MWSLTALRRALPPVRSITNEFYASSRQLTNLSADVVRLNNLADNEGSHKRSKRLGRGIGSGKGKTCGRGHKGQKSRSGGKAGRGPGFEGGQTPIYQRVPKRGFNNRFATPMTVINLDKLQLFIDMGRIDSNKKITLKELVSCGMVTCSKIKYGVKLLGKGAEHLTTPVEIEVTQASTCAIDAIEAVGGSITAVYYNRLGLRALLKPHKFETLPRFARPNPKKMRYYTNYEKRGYLSPEMQARKLVSASE